MAWEEEEEERGWLGEEEEEEEEWLGVRITDSVLLAWQVFMNPENASPARPTSVLRPTPDHVIYPWYCRRRRFFLLVSSLYKLMKDSPHHTIGGWFPIIFHWAVGLSCIEGGTILQDEMFVDAFYHGVAETQPALFWYVRGMLHTESDPN